MVKITAIYQGELHCLLTHGPSGSTLQTDAPKDNMGKGEAFSPTDLSAASLLTCVLTTIAIYGQRHNIEIKGAQGEILKEMTTEPPRRIARLTIKITMPKGIKIADRPTLERVGSSCPVHKSLSPEVQILTTFTYLD